LKGIVVYYSQTGNTRKIAREIRIGMQKIIGEVDIVFLKDIAPSELRNYDLIGLGSCWWGKLPPNFRNFIDSMVSLEGKHIFPFFTHGSLPAGCMHTTIPLLKEKGLTIIGFHDWYANSLQQFIPYPHLTSGHPDQTDLDQAEDFGQNMAQLSQRIYQGETQLIPPIPTLAELDEIYGKPMPPGGEMKKAEDLLLKQRKLNLEKCTHCGLCVENCPTDSIDFSVSQPIFKDSCARCWFCEQICPTGAIEMNWEEFTKFHDGSLDFLIKGLERAEAQGRFRRLISIEEVGFSNCWYKISQHPRFVIGEH